MSEKIAKMLRRLGKSGKAGKKEWKDFNSVERGIVRADYIERSEEAKARYTRQKKINKRKYIDEQISNS